MNKILNIFNGSAGGTYRKAGLPGELLIWHENYTVGALAPDPYDNDLLDLRSSFFPDPAKYKERVQAQLESLQNFNDWDEVIFWFDQDLFCQSMLIFFLDWFANKDLNGTKLSLISIDHLNGSENFRGLLATLVGTKIQIEEAHLSEGSLAWQAYTSKNPQELEQFLSRKQQVLPSINRALDGHLQKFPSVRNGLGAIENSLMTLISKQAKKTVFSHHLGSFIAEDRIYGTGDWGAFLALQKMTFCEKPLLSTDFEYLLPDHRYNPKCQVWLTDFGYQVLMGDKDYVRENGVDEWLGGVHLQGKTEIWRYDASRGKLKFF